MMPLCVSLVWLMILTPFYQIWTVFVSDEVEIALVACPALYEKKQNTKKILLDAKKFLLSSYNSPSQPRDRGHTGHKGVIVCGGRERERERERATLFT